MLTDSDRPPANTLGGKSNDLSALAAATRRKVCNCAVFGSLCCMTSIIEFVGYHSNCISSTVKQRISLPTPVCCRSDFTPAALPCWQADPWIMRSACGMLTQLSVSMSTILVGAHDCQIHQSLETIWFCGPCTLSGIPVHPCPIHDRLASNTTHVES
jgi:hypothetical protein